MSVVNQDGGRSRVPIRDGLLTGPLMQLADVHLAGCKCSTCGETSFGKKTVCANCGRETVVDVPLGNHGVLWSFTVVRHKPPGNYKGPDPFVPYGLGLVELPEGIRVMSPIEGPIEALKVGMKLRFKPYVRHDLERDVVAFAFEPEGQGEKNV